MKYAILIIGGGSIGKRHLRNLIAIGQKDISLVEVNRNRWGDLQKEFSIPIFSSLEEALGAKNFSIVFVCSPSAFHVKQALLAAQAGCHLFIEKPLSHSLEGLSELEEVANKEKLITMVGSNWKFYPLFQKMKELLEGGAIGRVLSARCQFGQYLPDWHPWEDYRQGYSANKELGGGILLDSHEFDYLTWFMGDEVKRLACFADKVSSLEVNVEDVAEVLLQFKSGAIAEIHLDYVQRFYQRNFEFFGEAGTMMWNAGAKNVVVQSKVTGEQEFPLSELYDINDMYVEEVKHFLDCVEHAKPTITPFAHGKNVLALIMAAKQSAKEMKTILL